MDDSDKSKGEASVQVGMFDSKEGSSRQLSNVNVGKTAAKYHTGPAVKQAKFKMF
jgi:hypothetical protein